MYLFARTAILIIVVQTSIEVPYHTKAPKPYLQLHVTQSRNPISPDTHEVCGDL